MAIDFIETPFSRDFHIDHQYHRVSHHGLLWKLVHELLHLIVLIFSLFGMIHFEVKFISIHPIVRRLVKIGSYLLIGHSWYLVLRFAVTCVTVYLFVFHLESYAITMDQFNCTLANAGPIHRVIQNQWGATDRSTHRVFSRFTLFKNVDWTYLTFGPDWFMGLIPVANLLVGPYTWLGYKAVLVFGFFSAAHLIMLAVFPLELYVEDHSFNHIRFVLNDLNCLKELYERRQLYLDQANLLSGFVAEKDSPWLKLISGQYSPLIPTGRPHQLLRASFMQPRPPAYEINKPPALGGNNGLLSFVGDQQRPPTGSPKAVAKRSQQHHHHQQQQQQKDINCWPRRRQNIMVANENLKKFVPHVRSESWFKVSMIVYPIFIFFYFDILLVIIGNIFYQFIAQLYHLDEACRSLHGGYLFKPHDSLLFYELIYTVFALSIASSFYCSYYYSTCLELLVWELEIIQQLDVCLHIVRLQQDLSQQQHLNNMSGPANFKSLTGLGRLDWEFNEFGGLSRAWYHLWRLFKDNQRQRNLRQQAWALHMAGKRETLFRATYINLSLFLDEHRATRHLTEKILARTTQLACAFALFVSVSYLQFESSAMRMFLLLAAALLILNLYMGNVAMVNTKTTQMNKVANRVAELNVACSKHNRPDLRNLFAVFAGLHGFEKDEFAHVLLNDRITLLNIIKFNDRVTSAYMFTRN